MLKAFYGHFVAILLMKIADSVLDIYVTSIFIGFLFRADLHVYFIFKNDQSIRY